MFALLFLGINHPQTFQLTGVYLHGSLAMGCFNPRKSDLDFIVVISDDITDQQKKSFMDKLVKINELAPFKGIEMSIVKKSVCKPFVYPTPFELHFASVHLKWFQEHPDDYIKRMNGTDKDLAAHFTIINHYGISLQGAPISEVFESVPKEAYLDSIKYDTENAKEDIINNTMYIVLNLCRVLAYVRVGLVLSKKQEGKWGIDNLSEKYRGLIQQALNAYETSGEMLTDLVIAKDFAEEAISEIFS